MSILKLIDGIYGRTLLGAMNGIVKIVGELLNELEQAGC